MAIAHDVIQGCTRVYKQARRREGGEVRDFPWANFIVTNTLLASAGYWIFNLRGLLLVGSVPVMWAFMIFTWWIAEKMK